MKVVKLVLIGLLVGMPVSLALRAGQLPESVRVPKVILVNGVLKDASGHAMTGTVAVQFSLYQDQQGGSALWTEVHNAAIDSEGRYTVALGSYSDLPLDQFASGLPRWLGIRVAGSNTEEAARTLIVSAPYALKASDADSLGGKPLSAFMLKPTNTVDTNISKMRAGDTEVVTSAATGTGSINRIPKWLETGGAGSLGDSAIVDSGGNIGIGTSTPGSKLDVVGGISVHGFPVYLAGAGDSNHMIGNVPGDGEQIRFWNFMDFFSPKDGGNIRLLSNGDFGLGTSTPTTKLDVIGAIAVNGNPIYLAGGGDTNHMLGKIAGDGEQLRFWNFMDFFSPKGGGNIRLLSNGDFGLGTTTPTTKLDVIGSIAVNGNAIYLAGGGDTNHMLGKIAGDGEQLRFWNFMDFFSPNGGGTVRILSNGNVGLGTTNPQARLDVAGGGDIRVGGDFTGTNRIVKSFTAGHSAGNVPSQLEVGLSDGFGTVGMTVKDVRDGSFNSQSIEFSTHHGGVSAGARMTIDKDGQVGVGTTTPTAKLDVNGGIKATTFAGDGSALTNVLSIANRTRGITYLGGCDTCSVLLDTDDQKTIYFNVVGAMTFQSVTCFADTGGTLPIINIKRDTGAGSPANILSSNLICDGSSATGFSITTLNASEKLDFELITAGGAAKRVTVAIKTLVN